MPEVSCPLMKRLSFSGADGPESKNAMFFQRSRTSVLTVCADCTSVYGIQVETMEILLMAYSVEAHSLLELPVRQALV